MNRAVREAAEARAVFVNAVDDPANATAYLGGAIARGGVTVAFSTSGRAPALAGLLREAFDELVPDDIEAWASRAHELRDRQRAEGVPMAERRPELLDALNRLYEGRERRAGRGRRSFMSHRPGSSRWSGAGPGDPDHLTFKAARCLREADLVLYDALVAPEVLALAVARRPRLRRQARRPRADLAGGDPRGDDRGGAARVSGWCG